MPSHQGSRADASQRQSATTGRRATLAAPSEVTTKSAPRTSAGPWAAAQGPALVRGADFVVTSDGAASVARRPVVALCRCDASARLPWCDGTHKRLA